MFEDDNLTQHGSQGIGPASVLSRDWPGPSPQAGAGDSETLLRALGTKLRAIARVARDTGDVAPTGVSPLGVKADLLECVATLHALQTTLTHELVRCRRLESELLDVRVTLALSRAELADTQHSERRARHLALHDGLTALPNRRCFDERLDQALEHVDRAHPGYVVLYLDLDGLKRINDRYGHSTGDELLKIVAARLRGAMRVQDVVSRLGGDEFACLLTDLLSREQLTHLARKLFDTVSAPTQIGEHGLVVRPSIGIATCPKDGFFGATVLARADVAMYRAKRERTGHAFFGDPGDDGLVNVRTPVAAPHAAAVPAPSTPKPINGTAPA